MKLTYWIAKIKDDANCYSIRGKTKKAVIAEVSSMEISDRYEVPVKITVEYTDSFDLLTQAVGEYSID